MSAHDHHHHHHHHDHDEGSTEDSMSSHLLKYMLDHNIHHVEELQSLIDRLESEGSTTAAASAAKALQSYRQGNDELFQAIKDLEPGSDNHD